MPSSCRPCLRGAVVLALALSLTPATATRAAAQCDPAFETPDRQTSGRGPRRTVVADFNDDGHLDVAVCHSRDGTVGVHLGAGDGTFAAVRTTFIGGAPFGLAAGDFNRDGLPDIVLGNRDVDFVYLMIGQGNGFFADVTTVEVGPQPHGVLVADFNLDGALDIAVANNRVASPRSALTSVALGRGTVGNPDGDFDPPISFELADIPVGVFAADLNRDGAPDLVATEQDNGSIAVLLSKHSNKGMKRKSRKHKPKGGLFTTAKHYPAGLNPYDVAIADLDDDGRLDLAVANLAGGGVSVLKGKGNGKFRDAEFYALGHNASSIAVADFSGDGVPDIAFTTVLPERLLLLKGETQGLRPTGTFVPGGEWSFSSPNNSAVGISTADFDENEKPDVAIVLWSGDEMLVFLDACGAAFRSAETLETRALPASAVSGIAPNPFSGSTTIALSMAKAGRAACDVFDMAGRRVRSLFAGSLSVGPTDLAWDGRDGTGRRLPSGIYLVRLRAPDGEHTRQIVLR